MAIVEAVFRASSAMLSETAGGYSPLPCASPNTFLIFPNLSTTPDKVFMRLGVAWEESNSSKRRIFRVDFHRLETCLPLGNGSPNFSWQMRITLSRHEILRVIAFSKFPSLIAIRAFSIS